MHGTINIKRFRYLIVTLMGRRRNSNTKTDVMIMFRLVMDIARLIERC